VTGSDVSLCRFDLREERGDVDAAMERCVGTQSATRLLELPLATGTVSALRVQPCDRDMYEALEKVTLGSGCLSPLVLELLVRLEIGALSDQLESGVESHGSIIERLRTASVAAVATILLAGVDLFFRGKLEGLLSAHKLVTSDSVSAPDLVIADIARVEPEEVVEAWPDIPIVGFTNHTDRAGLQRAHAAGFDQVIVKSALVERAGALVDELIGVA